MVEKGSYLVRVFSTEEAQVIRVPDHTTDRHLLPKGIRVISEFNPFDWVMLTSGACENFNIFRSKHKLQFFVIKKKSNITYS